MKKSEKGDAEVWTNADSMQNYLENMLRQGTELYVDGESVYPYEAVLRTVREDCNYMADFVLGASGTVRQIRFDRIQTNEQH